MVLIIFTYYSYYQIRDKTTLYFCFWLVTAVLVIICTIHHDGIRLLEFLFDPIKDNFIFADVSFATRLALFTMLIQAMMFVIFSRQFINLKKYHPIAFQFTNLYLFVYISNFLLFQVLGIQADDLFNLYPIVTASFLIYVLLLYCAVKRYQHGMVTAKFFIIGLLPYFVFRIFFLLGVFFGFQSPFAYLPDSGLQFFLSSSQVTQSVGLFIVAITMSLVLAKRTKFLQDELNENIQKQVDEAEKQKVVLEETVLERTSELREKNTMMEEISNQLAKYIPPQIHEALFAGKVDTKITTRRRKLTVFFSDIKNFTSTSENMQPEDLTKYLNEYFSEMTEIALSYGATIDKYIGDAMMVFFGDPESKGEREDARSCVHMALKMRDRISELQDKWQKQGFADPFVIRMGMNTGYCNVGNFGSDQRLTYTIIGSEVNVAQRLEASAQPGGILMSYETYAHAQDLIEVEQLNSISMKGVKREIKVFSALNKIERINQKKVPSEKLKNVPERIGDRLDALETKIEEILGRIK